MVSWGLACERGRGLNDHTFRFPCVSFFPFGLDSIDLFFERVIYHFLAGTAIHTWSLIG
jgi:hypothetical protein